MARKSILTKEAIITAALEIVSEGGKEALTARSLAERLNCSPHPILNQFKSMQEILEEVKKKALEKYAVNIRTATRSPRPLQDATYEILWFALNEPNLFRFAFLENHKRVQVREFIEMIHQEDNLMELLSDYLHLSKEETYELLKPVHLAVFGVLSLLTNDVIHLSIEEVNSYIESIWDSLRDNFLIQKDKAISQNPAEAPVRTSNIVNHIHRRIIQSDFIQGLQDSPHFLKDQEWYKIERLLSASYGLTRHALISKCPTLSETDRKLIYLLMLGFRNQHISIFFGIAQSSVSKAKQRLKLKTGSQSLEKFIQSI